MRSQSEPDNKSTEENHIKNEVVNIINDTNKKNNTAYLGIFGAHAPQNETLRIDILKHMDLPDLHFLQYIINELKKSENEKHPYKNSLLPAVLKLKETLLIPHVNELDKAAFWMMLCGFGLRNGFFCLLGLAGFIFDEAITEWRLSTELKVQLALKFNKGKMAYLDHYHGMMGTLSRVGSSGLNVIEKISGKVYEYLPSVKK